MASTDPERTDDQRSEEEEDKDRRAEIKRDDDVVEETAEDSFPASDPPSYSGATGGTRDDDEG